MSRNAIDNVERAWRLARAIVSDIVMYNEAKVKEGIENDSLFDLLEGEIKEGRDLFKSRVTDELFSANIFDRALVDRMLKPKGNIKSRIW